MVFSSNHYNRYDDHFTSIWFINQTRDNQAKYATLTPRGLSESVNQSPKIVISTTQLENMMIIAPATEKYNRVLKERLSEIMMKIENWSHYE